MTAPIPADRLAELRRIATGEDWSPAQPQDVAALIGEIDRLTAEREQLIAAILRLKQQPRIPLEAWYAYATVLDMARGTRIGLRGPQDAPEGITQ